MSELLLEILSEEIPARMQAGAIQQLAQAIINKLGDNNISYKNLSSYVTPRRMTVCIEGLPEKQNDSVIERKGPKVGANDSAIEGFLKSNNLLKSDLTIQTTDKGEFYFAIIKQKGREVSQVLTEIITEVLNNFIWPKSMRWGNHDITWVRPVHRIICLLSEKILPIKFGHIKAGDVTSGHRIKGKETIKVKNFLDYSKQLKDNYIILCSAERKQIINNQINALIEQPRLRLVEDELLLEEIVGLVEWPVVMLGKIDEQFIDLPEEVLISVMRTHQKYFALRDKDNKLAPYFIAVSNIEQKTDNLIIKGFERVLRARFSDARFFFDNDIKSKLSSKVDELKNIVFHEKVGSVYDKIERIKKISDYLASKLQLSETDKENIKEAARLSKADLLTEMVGEFPELQGIMGGYYAQAEGKNSYIVQAISQHYLPLGQNSTIPTNAVSYIVALADKLDSLISLFLVGEKPTGSKDPFALRRSALGIIKIILENKLELDLLEIISYIINQYYPRDKFQSEYDSSHIEEFLKNRFKVILKESGYNSLVEAVLETTQFHDRKSGYDYYHIYEKLRIFKQYLQEPDGQKLLELYKRANNLIDNKSSVRLVDMHKINNQFREELYNASEKLKSLNVKGASYKERLAQAVKYYDTLSSFLQNIRVSEEENDRIILTNFVRQLDCIANFALINPNQL